MTPPEAKGAGSDAKEPQVPPAVCVCLPVRLTILAKRADFLRAAAARRQGTPGFLLQARARGDDSPTVRVGYTCSKKIGNAVARNRAKRRLREVARAVMPALARPGWDYVLVGRPGATIDRNFAALLGDLATAVGQVHKDRPK
ncbi:MAG: ribonuclease P protein component [Paracoccaceae bacterium]|nr:ribonuclease P protein component [Paracoccaceae bacterium]